MGASRWELPFDLVFIIYTVSARPKKGLSCWIYMILDLISLLCILLDSLVDKKKFIFLQQKRQEIAIQLHSNFQLRPLLLDYDTIRW